MTRFSSRVKKVIGAGVFAFLILLSKIVTAQYNVIHFDMQENCIPDSITDRLYGTLYESGVASVRNAGAQMGVDVTDSGNMSYKSRQSVDDVISTINFFGQLGWNAAGTSEPLLLLSNLADSDCDGMNAWYSPVGYDAHMMAIYYGHPQAADSMAKDYDFASHEYAHGFFGRHQGSETHEIGALNESVADMFGAAYKAWMTTGKSLDTLVAREDSYLVGEYWAQVMRDYYSYDVANMRDMSDPAAGGDPDYYDSRMARQTQIHSLAGVTNLGFYLMSQGGTHPRGASSIQVQGIGISKSIQLVYYAFVHRLPFSNMPEFSDAIRKAAIRIYGVDSVEYRSANSAFIAVGLQNNLPDSLTNPASDTPPEQQPLPEPITASEPEPTSDVGETADETVNESESTDISNGPDPSTHQGLSISGPTFMASLLVIIVASSIWLGFLGRQKKPAVAGSTAETYESANSGYSMMKERRSNEVPPPPKPAPQSSRSPVSQTNDVAKPATPVKSVVSAVICANEQRFSLNLDASPVTLGRSSELNLPNELKDLFAKDAHMSRKHCSIWCKPATGELYVQSLTENPLSIEGQEIEPKGKAKVDFDQPIRLLLGQTIIVIEPGL